jgi:nitroreductase
MTTSEVDEEVGDVGDTIDAIRNRRSIRCYGDRPIAPEVLSRLEDAMLRSPSSRGLRPWRFVFVTDRAKLTELSRAKEHHAGFLADAALGVVICGDETVSDAWVEDCSIAATVLMLAAASLGIGSCWVQIRMRQRGDGSSAEGYVRGILGLPEQLRVECIVSLGEPAEEKPALVAERLKQEAIERV